MSKRVAITNTGRLLGLSFVLLSAALAAGAQCTSADPQERATQAKAEVSRIGTAEASSAPTFEGYEDRCRQANVYWHDKDWHIDLLLPSEENDPYSLKIRSGSGSEKILKLDDVYSQIASISLAPNDEAIVVAFVYGNWSGLFNVASIVGLKGGNVIDKVVASSFSISPNRRFLIYLNGDETFPVYDYRLYDVLRTPRENTCGYRENDPEHKDFDEEYRGIPLYPKKAKQVSCSEADQKPFEDENHQRVSNFLWSGDSNKVLFIDARDEKNLDIILVTMPSGPKNLPRTSIYRLDAAQIGWSNSMSTGEETIPLSWDSESDDVVSIRSGDANPLIIPLSKFVEVE